jgi:teichuronic acid biosynthesis glycosyltransferase TuaH
MTLLVVGPASSDLGTDYHALVKRSNVVAIGPRPFEEMPQWLDIMHVGLLPYHVDEFNRGSFPLKTLEYLVAGLPVVSTPLPASEWLGSPDVVIARDSTAFADVAWSLASQQRTPADVARRKDFAMLHSWDARAQQLLRLLKEKP